MDIYSLTINQLQRAAAIKEQIEHLNTELRAIFGAPTESRAMPKKNRTMSAAAKKKIAAAQRARWANLRRAKTAAGSLKTPGKAKKKRMTPAGRAKISAKMKAYWAAKKAGRK